MSLYEILAGLEKQGVYLTLERTCELLQLTESDVGDLVAQDRLSREWKDGEFRYYCPSVYSQRIETLMRTDFDGLKPREIREIVNEVASLQFALGHMRGLKEATRFAIESEIPRLRAEPTPEEERKTG